MIMIIEGTEIPNISISIVFEYSTIEKKGKTYNFSSYTRNLFVCLNMTFDTYTFD